MADYVNRSLDQFLDLPEVQYVFNDTRLGASVPAPPVLMVQAVHDRIIGVDDIDALAETYTAGGAAVTYHRDILSGHTLLHPMSAPMALRWLTDRFAGRPLTSDVVRTTWPTLLNPATYRGMAQLTLIAAKVITGRSIGRPRLVSPVRGVRLHPAMTGRRTQTRGSSRATSSNSQHAVTPAQTRCRTASKTRQAEQKGSASGISRNRTLVDSLWISGTLLDARVVRSATIGRGCVRTCSCGCRPPTSAGT